MNASYLGSEVRWALESSESDASCGGLPAAGGGGTSNACRHRIGEFNLERENSRPRGREHPLPAAVLLPRSFERTSGPIWQGENLWLPPLQPPRPPKLKHPENSSRTKAQGMSSERVKTCLDRKVGSDRKRKQQRCCYYQAGIRHR